MKKIFLFLSLVFIFSNTLQSQSTFKRKRIEAKQRLTVNGKIIYGITDSLLNASPDSLLTSKAVFDFFEKNKQAIDVNGTPVSIIDNVYLYRDTSLTPNVLYWHDGVSFQTLSNLSANDQTNGLDISIDNGNIEIEPDFAEVEQLTSVDNSNDKLLILDDNFGLYKYVTPSQLGGGGGGGGSQDATEVPLNPNITFNGASTDDVQEILDSLSSQVPENIGNNCLNYLPMFETDQRDYTLAGLEYIDANNRRIYQNMKGQYWNSYNIENTTTGIWRINTAIFYHAVAGTDNTDDTLTYVGTNQVVSNSGSMGTSYTRFDGAGEYVEFTFSGKTEIYAVLATLTNGGYANVTINGGTDLVNLVDLNGVNRRISSYSDDNSNTNIRIPLSNILDPSQIYTVRITATGTKPTASSDEYINFEGFGTNMQNIDEGLTPLYGLKILKTISYTGSEYEYAYSIKPTGATQFEWTGSGHLNESMSANIYDDAGNIVDVDATNTTYSSKYFKIIEHGQTQHSQVANVANVYVEKNFVAGKVSIFHRHRWLIQTECNSALIAMFPVREEFDRGYVVGDYSSNVPYVLSNDNDSKSGRIASNLAFCYDLDSRTYAALYVPSLASSQNFRNSVDKTYIEDRTGGSLNKIYFQKVDTSVNTIIPANQVWESTSVYYIGRSERIDKLIN